MMRPWAYANAIAAPCWFCTRRVEVAQGWFVRPTDTTWRVYDKICWQRLNILTADAVRALQVIREFGL